MATRVNCSACQQCRVTHGEVCYCKVGHWRGRLLAHVSNIRRICGDYDPAGGKAEVEGACP